jgi:3',5'-cyclic AMP phosphodiesterase CpdA
MLRLAILGDAHYSTAGARRANLVIQHSPTLLEAAVRQIARRPDRPDFLFQIGDLIDGMGLSTAQRRRDLEGAVGLIDEAGVPWTWVPGNHDVESFEGDRRALLPYLRRDRTYGEMERGGCVFLLLDTALPEIHGHVDEEQQAWLEEALVRHRDRRVFVVQHHVFNWSVADDMYIDNGERIEARLVEARCVKAVFFGHSHTNRVDTIEDLHEIATGALCSWPLLFRRVEINGDHMTTWTERIEVSEEIYQEACEAIEEKPRPWRDQMLATMLLKLRT